MNEMTLVLEVIKSGILEKDTKFFEGPVGKYYCDLTNLDPKFLLQRIKHEKTKEFRMKLEKVKWKKRQFYGRF